MLGSTRRTTRLALAAAVAVASVLAGCSSDSEPEPGADPAASSSAAPTPPPKPDRGSKRPPSKALAGFYDQTIAWKPCKQGSAHLCGALEVPLDYRHPARDSIELSVLKVPAGEPDRRVGSLVVNPGGPGAPGTTYAASGGLAWGAPLRDAYDLVGFNPRGTVDSEAVDCLSDQQLDGYVETDPTPDDAAEAAAFTRWARTMARGCARSPNISGHVSTVEAARDMDVLRAALGESRLDYFGASYGTKLGSTYASLFPKKVGRVVLDAAMAPGLTGLELNLAQARGFEVALRSYLRNCVAEDDCFLGDSVAEGLRTVQGLLRDVDARPLKVGDRELTAGGALYGLIMPLYSRDYWYLLDAGLQKALEGDGSGLLLLADAYSSRTDSGYKDNSVEANWAINCLDDPHSRTPTQVRRLLPRFERASPTFGDALAWMTAGCTGQRLRAVEEPPRIKAPGAAPIVVVGTTRDPATPYAWAKQLATALDSGVLISRDGDGHGGYNSGNPCVDDAVEAYLLRGTVPRDGLSC